MSKYNFNSDSDSCSIISDSFSDSNSIISNSDSSTTNELYEDVINKLIHHINENGYISLYEHDKDVRKYFKNDESYNIIKFEYYIKVSVEGKIKFEERWPEQQKWTKYLYYNLEEEVPEKDIILIENDEEIGTTNIKAIVKIPICYKKISYDAIMTHDIDHIYMIIDKTGDLKGQYTLIDNNFININDDEDIIHIEDMIKYVNNKEGFIFNFDWENIYYSEYI